MNKLFRCDLEIQGKGVLHSSKIFCSIMYHSESIQNDRIGAYENILGQVFKLVVKEFAQKTFYGEFKLRDIPTNLSMDIIEKDFIEKEVTLSQYSFDENDVKFEVTSGSEWCYPDILADAMKKFFNFHYTELSGVSFLHMRFSGKNEIINRQKALLRDILGKYEALTDRANATIIETFNAEKRHQMELVDELTVFEKQLLQ